MIDKMQKLKELSCLKIPLRYEDGSKAKRKKEYDYIYYDGERLYATNGGIILSLKSVFPCSVGYYDDRYLAVKKKLKTLNYKKLFNLEEAIEINLDEWSEDDNYVYFDNYLEDGYCFKLDYCCICKDFIGEIEKIYLNAYDGILIFEGKNEELAAVKYCVQKYD